MMMKKHCETCRTDVPLYEADLAAAHAAIQWVLGTWPDVDGWPIAETGADLHPAFPMEVRSHMGYRIGWIDLDDDTQSVFVRAYCECS